MDRIVRPSASLILSQHLSSSQQVSASNVRKSFLDFFCKNNDHLHVRSSPVFSILDPSLAFVNAGMNQFKNIFLGAVPPPRKRIANSQKCIRIGGKHNDLLEVGRDGSHHTFFEMLGNWSFGDYFKKEACTMSWQLLTEGYRLPPERLYVTYFEGDRSLGLDPDSEVLQIWREIGIEENRILPCGAKHNFWEVGSTGPCGPCTEIHYDHIPGRTNVGHLVNAGRRDLTELWNLVFIQYDRRPEGGLEKLKNHFVDTGMGFERLVAVLQNKMSNYDTDLFAPLFEAVRKFSGRERYAGKYEGDDSLDYGYRVLADHGRMITVALSDGMIPNQQNKVRKILRRAQTISEKYFNVEKGLLKELSNHVADTLSDAYPEIGENLQKIQYVIDAEEETFKALRSKSSKLLEGIIKRYPNLADLEILESPHLFEGIKYIEDKILNRDKKTITDEDAWKLYDSLGVPVDVTQNLARSLGLAFDMDSFERYQLKYKADSKTLQETTTRLKISAALHPDVLNKLEKMNLEPTVDRFKYEYTASDCGRYRFEKRRSTILAIISENDLVEELSAEKVTGHEETGLILDCTQLFGREDNQESDRGTFTIENDIVFNITRVNKVKGVTIHFGTFENFPRGSTVAVRQKGTVEIDEDRRFGIMRNHTALHLLNLAARESFPVSGEKHSLVGPEKFAYDLMIFENKLTRDDLKTMEDFVRTFIIRKARVQRRMLERSSFEKLKDVVVIPGQHVLESEIPVVEISTDLKTSREYCTGTHVRNASDLGDFVIVKCSNASFGVKSIEAVTGNEAFAIRETDSRIRKRCDRLKEKVEGFKDPNDRVQLYQLFSEVERESEAIRSSDLSAIAKMEITVKLENTRNVTNKLKKHFIRSVEADLKNLMNDPDTRFVVHCFDSISGIRPERFEVVKNLRKPLLLISKFEGSAHVLCSVPKNIVTKTFSAREWLLNSSADSTFERIGRRNSDPSLFYTVQNWKPTEEVLNETMEAAKDYARLNLTGS